jgi:alkyl hydroperoxide reductase subunit F
LIYYSGFLSFSFVTKFLLGKMPIMFDLIIIGGGPAGCAAAVYAARKQLKSLLISPDFGGQSIVSSDIHNWIGDQSISGNDLAKKLEEHVRSYEGDWLQILKDRVTNITKTDTGFEVHTEKGVQATKTILIASGSKRRKLQVPGAEEFENKGIVYCASCDGPLFSGMDVAVIGGGNAGFESAAQLLAYCKSVTLLHRNDSFKADPITIEKVLANPKMKGILNAEIVSIEGEQFVSGLTYRDKTTDEVHQLEVQGIFVEIGAEPNTVFAKEVVDLDQLGHIKIDPWTQATSTEGIWAAGDCTNIKYHQNNIAAGDAVRAVEDIYYSLHT